MYESAMEKNEGSGKLKRRAFLVGSASALAGLTLWSLRKPHLAEAASTQTVKQVTIVMFSDAGERLKTVQVPKVIKSDAEWKKQLTPNAFDITRRADTNLHTRENTGTCTTRASTAAFAATTRCSAQTRSLILEPDGPVSGSRLRRKTSSV